MILLEKIKNVRDQFNADLECINDLKSWEDIKSKYLGRKGIVSSLFLDIKELDPEDRKVIGKALNDLKNDLQTQLDSVYGKIHHRKKEEHYIDYTLPGLPFFKGTRHPLTQAIDEMLSIFARLGFDIAYGPEVETDWYNFSSLNLPPHHPARDMQDTFYVDDGIMLRTHTSPVQTRYMSTHTPPVRIVAPGRVYRNEAISTRSYCMFHQIEGLYVDKKVTFADLRGTIELFCKMYFGKNAQIKFRTSFFPFTEPSAEVDVSCFLCQGKGCRVCKHTGWLEIMGCGMVDPNVFQAVGYDPEKVTGFAFGLGVDRSVMLKLDIHDIRMLFDNDVEFLKQF
ncbi:MAG: phenylalanine--tRNA ligase subunit alpha [Candidatus Marinimicrobia bacterium]|nr:phenylalanine--tRNA ligase subunit alpha [Candidatus Neomarinimicrobiota bacterium]MDD5582592.1 phenylalanine--tRNA ligase subunit alpha [Candidatus Neomarinimicrobiota bacterium]